MSGSEKPNNRPIIEGFDDVGSGCTIINRKNEVIGTIEKERVGRFMHWVFIPSRPSLGEDYIYTNGCLKEISAKITEMYNNEKRK